MQNPKVFSFIGMVFIIAASCTSVFLTPMKVLWCAFGLIGGLSMGYSGYLRRDQWLMLLEGFFVVLNLYGMWSAL